MANYENANFTPDAPNFKTLVTMSFQGLTNFPYIEEDFDALTNYGLLSKVVEYLNEVISNNNEQNDLMTGLYNAYVSLQNYVNTYFDNLDVQDEINNKLDAMAQDGSLTQLIKGYVDPYINEQNNRLDQMQNQINAVESGSPLVASSTSGMTDTSRVYVNTSDGKWYYYNGTAWTIGGTYQATQIADNSVTYKMVKNDILKSQNMKNLLSRYNINSIIQTNKTHLSLFSSGVVGDSGKTRLSNFNYLSFSNNPLFKLLNDNIYYFVNVYTVIDKQENTLDFADLDLELGGINTSGNNVTSTYQLRTPDFIEVDSDTLFEPDYNNYLSYVFKYDSDGNFIERIDITAQLHNVTLTSTYKYKFVFKVDVTGADITDRVAFFIESVKNSILTEMYTQITSGWQNYSLTFTNSNTYRYKLCMRIGNGTSSFTDSNEINDFMFISDDLLTPLQNKKISILGDSFSAFNNQIPSGNSPYYMGNNAGVTNYNQMWWQRLISNNAATKGTIQASSGSNVSYIREQSLCLSNTNMCESLDDPDIVVILGGTNDFSHTPALIGTYDGTQNFPTTNNNFSDAYALMLSRITTKYPNATVFCCGIPLFVRTNLNKAQPEKNTETNGEHKTIFDYSEKIRQIAQIMNCQYIDMNECGFNRENYYSTYCEDSSTNPTHPNAKGQEVIYKVIENKILEVMNNLK